MTRVIEVREPTIAPVGNGAGPQARVVVRLGESASPMPPPGYAIVFSSGQVKMLEATWSDSAYQPIDSPNVNPARWNVALITTFAPEPYEVKKPLSISIYSADEQYGASFFDANIHTTGDNEQEAFENIKSLILDMFDGLVSRRIEDLGPGPMHQRDVLQQFIRKVS